METRQRTACTRYVLLLSGNVAGLFVIAYASLVLPTSISAAIERAFGAGDIAGWTCGVALSFE